MTVLDYDSFGRMTAARFDSDSSSDRTWTGYNGFGEITSSGVSLGSFSASLSFQFDADGNRTRVTYGDSNYVTYGFDGLDRPTSVLRSGSTTLVSYTYNSRGSRATIGGNFATSYGYYPDGRLSSLTNTPLASGYSAQYTFNYNPASQIVQQSRNNDAFAWTGAVNGTQSYSVNGLNQYTMAGFSHDANGNLTSDGSTTYVFDVENRLVSASGAKNAMLRYDPMGRLYETSGGSAGLTRFAYDGDALVQEFNGSGTLLRRYVHGIDAGDDPLVWFEGAGFTNSEQRLLRSDHQGSIVAVADATSSGILAVNTYDEYGVQGSSNQGRFQYTGQTWMPELGLYYYKARMYAPSLGRFMQTDPIGYADYLNLYAYVDSDPVNHLDSLGTCKETGSIISKPDGECKVGSGASPGGAIVMESRGGNRGNQGQGERNTTSSPERPTKGVRPVRDKDGNITGWQVPTSDGKGKIKSLEWGTQNGLDPADFPKIKSGTKIGGNQPGTSAPGAPPVTESPADSSTSGGSNAGYYIGGTILIGAGIVCAIAEPCGGIVLAIFGSGGGYILATQ